MGEDDSSSRSAGSIGSVATAEPRDPDTELPGTLPGVTLLETGSTGSLATAKAVPVPAAALVAPVLGIRSPVATIPLDVQAILARRHLAPSIALVGPDGAGKSGTGARLAAAWPGPTVRTYMGMGRGLTSTSPANPAHVPGLSAVAGIALQWTRWVMSVRERRRGRAVIFDRYTEDAWLPPVRTGAAARLGRAMRSAAACPNPDLLVILNAPGAVMFGRKGEFDPETLDAEAARYRALARRPRSVLVDSTRPFDEVVDAIFDALWISLRSRGRDGRGPA